MANRYRMRAKEVWAEQFDLEANPLFDTFGAVNFGDPDTTLESRFRGHHWIRTYMGPVVLNRGDWIVKDEVGRFYVMQDKGFHETFEPAQHDAAASVTASAHGTLLPATPTSPTLDDEIRRAHQRLNEVEHSLNQMRLEALEEAAIALHRVATPRESWLTRQIRRTEQQLRELPKWLGGKG